MITNGHDAVKVLDLRRTVSDLVPHALGDRPKRLELCDLMEHNPEPIVYTRVISRKTMTDCLDGLFALDNVICISIDHGRLK